VYYNFIDQVHNLLNDVSIWGDESNFKGTINMDNPFSHEPIHADGLIDKIVNAHWYKKMNAQCKELYPDEPYLILSVVGYFYKQAPMAIKGINWNHFLSHLVF